MPWKKEENGEILGEVGKRSWDLLDEGGSVSGRQRLIEEDCGEEDGTRGEV